MRVFAMWLVSRPIRLIELCSAIVLMVAATTVASTFGTAVFLYSLATLLLVLLLMSYLDQGRPGR
jgi:hypothetical protein